MLPQTHPRIAGGKGNVCQCEGWQCAYQRLPPSILFGGLITAQDAAQSSWETSLFLKPELQV